MEEILNDLSDSSLVSAIESNVFAFFRQFKKWSVVEFNETPELMWSLTDIPFPLFNSVLKARLSADIADDAINAAIARCKSKNVPMLWWVGPSTRPPDLGSRLSVHGFLVSGLPGMAIDLNSLPENLALPEGLVIRKVDSEAELANWCQVLCTGFNLPVFTVDVFFDFYKSLGFDSDLPICNFLSYLEDVPVASSALFLGAGVAGIYNVATLNEARRKGIGSALTEFPLFEARASGYRAGILYASESGYNVYRKLGFKEYCKLFQYVWTGN